MRATKIEVGQRFSRWAVKCELQPRKKHRVFECECECGTVAAVYLSALLSGASGSCGCLRREVVTTHGASWKENQTAEYRTWVSMRARCRKEHRNYGERGIRVCERWDLSFEAFLSDMGPRPPHTSIDRIDNNGNYEPRNCRWATMQQQLRNTRRNVWVQYKGRRMLLIEAACDAGFNLNTAETRRRRGWPDERLFDPVNPAYANRPQTRGQTLD